MSRKVAPSNQEIARQPINRVTIALSVLAAFLVIVANSAFWAYHYFFNSQQFTETVTISITSERSREAIASNITEKIFETRPIAKRLFGELTTKLLSELLSSSQFEESFRTVTEKTQLYLTSSADREDITFNIAGAKNIIDSIANLTASERVDQINDKATNIPDEIVLVESDNVPNLYPYGVALLWIGPIALVVGITLFLFPYIKKRTYSYRLVVLQSISLIGGGLTALLVGPLFKPPILSNFDSTNNRIVAEELYNSFMKTFNQQTSFIIVVGISILFVASIVKYYPVLKQVVTTNGKKTASV